jgi:Na+/melibiose symporter-like transporter
MLMFFTLGSSMVGDICDEDELQTGTRNEGSYYSVYWWFIKMGSAFASFVMGALLVLTGFDERQSVSVDALRGSIALVKSEAEKWPNQGADTSARSAKFLEQLDAVLENLDKLRQQLAERLAKYPDRSEHISTLIERSDSVRAAAAALQARASSLVATPADVTKNMNQLLAQASLLAAQTPQTLFRLRLFEIGVPLALSIVSILLTLRYPLTEARWKKIKEALNQRHAEGN